MLNWKDIKLFIAVGLLISTSYCSAAAYYTAENCEETIALWNFETAVELSDGKVIAPDNDDGFPRANRQLVVYDGSAWTYGAELQPGIEAMGNAWVLDGNSMGVLGGTRPYYTTVGASSFPFTGRESIKIECWVWIDSTQTENQWIMRHVNNWRLFYDTARQKVSWYCYLDDGSNTPTIRADMNTDVWQHITAYLDPEEGLARVTVRDLNGNQVGYNQWTLPQGAALATVYHHFSVGSSYKDNAPTFKGMLDNIKISSPGISETTEYNTPREDTNGTLGLWNMEQISNDIILDDSLWARGNDLTVHGIDDPNYPESLSGFGNALTFVDNYATASAQWGGYSTMKFDAWVRTDDITSHQHIAQAPDAWRIRLSGKQIYVDVRNGVTDSYDTYTVDYDQTEGYWQHISVEYNDQQELVIGTINDTTVFTGTESLKQSVADVKIGVYNQDSSTDSRYWLGDMDDIKISSSQAALQCGDWGYALSDFNQDCYVDIDDLLMMASNWIGDNQNIDITANGTVNNEDYSVLSDTWLGCSEPYSEGCQSAN